MSYEVAPVIADVGGHKCRLSLGVLGGPLRGGGLEGALDMGGSE